MRMWLDTEFNGWHGELISLALVAEDGREFYEVLGCLEPVAWVKENVMPVLNKDNVSVKTLQNKLDKWLKRYNRAQVKADWPDDVKHFCEVLITGPGKYIRTPSLTLEIITHLPGTHETSLVPHNALADARAFKKSHLAWEAALDESKLPSPFKDSIPPF